MSRTAFAERFSRVLGIPPARYVAEWRMQQARRLLRDRHLPIAEVAMEMGYTSEAAFSRAFKRIAGTSPGQIRRREQELPSLDRRGMFTRRLAPLSTKGKCFAREQDAEPSYGQAVARALSEATQVADRSNRPPGPTGKSRSRKSAPRALPAWRQSGPPSAIAR